MYNFLNVLPFSDISDDVLTNLIDGVQSDSGQNILNLHNLNALKFDQFYVNNNDNNNDDELRLNNFINVNVDTSKCYYHLSDNYKNIFPKDTNTDSLSMCCFNINSIPKNILAFQTQCLDEITNSFDIIGFVETKLNDEISNLFNITSYNKHLLNNSRHSGGLALYYKNSLSIIQRQDLNKQSEHIESLFIEIESNEKNIICGLIYHRPNSSNLNFISDLEWILSKIDNENKIVYIMCDFNIDLLNYPTCNLTETLVNLLHSFNLINLIDKPTRVTQTSATIIDHMWTNNYRNTKLSGILYESISDHFPIFTSFKLKSIKSNNYTKKEIQFRDNNEQNISKLKHLLAEADWNLIINNNNPETAYDNFILIFQNCYNKCIPLITKTINTKHHSKPYINNEIKQLIKAKNKLQRKYSKHPITYSTEYKHLRNQVR